jgi:hypothetical protein
MDNQIMPNEISKNEKSAILLLIILVVISFVLYIANPFIPFSSIEMRDTFGGISYLANPILSIIGIIIFLAAEKNKKLSNKGLYWTLLGVSVGTLAIKSIMMIAGTYLFLNSF